MSPVVTMMIGRLDDWIEVLVKRDGILTTRATAHWAGIACFKRAYPIFRERGYRARLLAAAYRHHLHWSELIGGDIVLTIPHAWQRLFNESGLEVAPRMDEPVPEEIVAELYRKLPDFRRAYDARRDDGRGVRLVRADGAHAPRVHRLLPGPGGDGPRLHAPEPGPPVAPRRNRVTPLGELVADPGAGLVYGNRGCLHDAPDAIRRRVQRQALDRLPARVPRPAPHSRCMQPGRYTELFFLDEATAFAAGHRPCAECRREDYGRFRRSGTSFIPGRPVPTRSTASPRRAPRSRHASATSSRLVRRRPAGRRVRAPSGRAVPRAWRRTAEWTAAGYTRRLPRPAAAVTITPPSLVAVLGAGWSPDVPLLHPTSSRLPGTVRRPTRR